MKGFKKIFRKSVAAVLTFVMVLTTAVVLDGGQVQAAPAQPFGLVVSCPADNTIGVVWGRGEIDSYNVYIDNAKVASNVGCAYYEYKGYSAGNHTVSVTTVSGGSESAKTSETVNVTGTTSSSSSSMSTGDKVVVYADINYSGASATLGVGQYTLADLQRAGISNDTISSIKLPLGYKVTVFQDDNFSGSTQVYSDMQSKLDGWNDRISSIIIEEAKYYIVNKNSGLVLDIEGGNKDNGGNVIQWTKNGGTNQQFKAVSTGDGYYYLVSAMHGKVIDVEGVSKENGANVHMWDNVGGANQQWSVDFVDGAYAYIVSRNSGKSLDADGWGTKAGGNVIQWQLGNMQTNQLWKFVLANTEAAKPSGNAGNNNAGNTGNTAAGDLPQIPNLEARSDRMYLKLNNDTNGKYSNNQIYWCILGYNSNNELCYVDKNGNLVKADPGMNTISKSDRKCANICYTLAEKDYVYLPDIISGRMYLSYGEQVYVTFNVAADGRVGYAGPDLNNKTDPNQDVLFEFIEFTVKNKEYWGNTTRVDFFSFPVVSRLIGTNGYTNGQYYANYDRTVGDLGTRDEIFGAYKNEVPNEFDTLLTDKRIMAPCKLTFNEGAQYAHYYDAYINEFWNKYASQDLVFSCQAGTFRGRVEGDRMKFTKDGDGGTYYVYKPTTQDVLEGKGNFNRGNSTELVIEAQLCAAFNRGVATQPENYANASAFYKNSVSNFYSGFMHNHSYYGYSYGFCYDDVNDFSTLLHFTNPTGLIIDLRW